MGQGVLTGSGCIDCIDCCGVGQGVLTAVRVYWLLWSGSGCIDCCGVGQGVLTAVEWVRVY